MKKEKVIILLTVILMLFIVETKAQTLIPTPSISTLGAADDFKGGYTFSYSSSGTPWNGALISFGGFEWNNYDCQISSDYGPNGGNHISFRTKNGDANIWNSWNELATRGVNNFIGDQIINGSITSTSNSDEGGYLDIKNPSKSDGANSWRIYNMTGDYGNSLQFWAYSNCSSQYPCGNHFTIMDTGNVGIGIMIPKNKLDVDGTIHSKEVKVDMIGWSDFVFKKEYDLPTLKEVEKHITEKGHLENIPSEEEVLQNGINLGEMNARLLQKIEELTLYSIEQNKKIEKLQEENKKILDIEKRLEKIEKESK